MAESPLYGKMCIAASKIGARLFRNHVGRSQHVDKDGNKRWVTTGLGTGTSDLVGFTPVVITPDMVGRTVAVFTAVEAKDKKKATEEQLAFIAAVKRAGGLAGVAHDVDECLLILTQRQLV